MRSFRNYDYDPRENRPENDREHGYPGKGVRDYRTGGDDEFDEDFDQVGDNFFDEDFDEFGDEDDYDDAYGDRFADARDVQDDTYYSDYYRPSPPFYDTRHGIPGRDSVMQRYFNEHVFARAQPGYYYPERGRQPLRYRMAIHHAPYPGTERHRPPRPWRPYRNSGRDNDYR